MATRKQQKNQISIFYFNGAITLQAVENYDEATKKAEKMKKNGVSAIFYEEWDDLGCVLSENIFVA